MKKTVREGNVFGKLTVVRRNGTQGKSAMWLCQCACGSIQLKRVSGSNLSNGNVRSCGCIAQSNEWRVKTHGRSSSRVYSIWKGMKNRCLLQTDPYYHRYGGRGIQIDERWLKFEDFYADMGDPPSSKHTLDRLDRDGHYTVSNCRWATPTEQANNRISNRLLTVDGVTATIAEWARRTGLPKSTIRERLKRQWTEADAVNMPRRKVGV